MILQLQDKTRISINHKIKRIKKKEYKQDEIELSQVHQCKNKIDKLFLLFSRFINFKKKKKGKY